MSAKGEPTAGVGGGYNAGGLIAYPLPDEIAIPLRREELETLCEGGIGEERASRDLYVGAAVGTIAGFIGVMATTDWDTVWTPARRWWFLIPFLILCIMAAISIMGVCVHQHRLKRTLGDSPFSRLKARLLRLFDAPRTANIALDNVATASLVQGSTGSGVRWDNVANLLWLGNDLDWTIQVVKTGGPKDRILHGLIQSIHHLGELGLISTVPGRLLLSLKKQVESASDTTLTQSWRLEFSAKVAQALEAISSLAQIQQKTFRPSP